MLNRKAGEHFSFLIKAFFIFTVVCVAFSFGAEEIIGTIQEVSGQTIISATGVEDAEAKVGMQIPAGYSVSTKANSKAVLKLVDGSLITISESSSIVLNEALITPDDSAKKSSIGLLFGKIGLKIQKGDGKDVKVHTPTAIAAVRGTEFEVALASDGSTVVGVDEGNVNMATDGGDADLDAGKAGSVTIGDEKKGVSSSSEEESAKFLQDRDEAVKKDPMGAIKTLASRMEEKEKDGNELIGADPSSKDEALALNDKFDTVKTGSASINALASLIVEVNKGNEKIEKEYNNTIKRINERMENLNRRIEAALRKINERYDAKVKEIENNDTKSKLDNLKILDK